MYTTMIAGISHRKIRSFGSMMFSVTASITPPSCEAVEISDTEINDL